MGYEIEFKLINIKNMNKIQHVEEVDESLFGELIKVTHISDISNEYYESIMQSVSFSIACDAKYIGCTNRIGHFEFEIIKESIKYVVVFQHDTYENNFQLTVKIGYKNLNDKEKMKGKYDEFLEKLKLHIKNNIIKDWEKCIWISDTQSLWLAEEVYTEIYRAENELRAFVSKVMIDSFGAEWYDRPEFTKMKASIELNANDIKKNVPSFANIDISLYTITLEGLMTTIKSDIYTEKMEGDENTQREIKEKIFSTTQLDKMQSTLDFLKSKYKKQFNIWNKFFEHFIDEPSDFQNILNKFITNRNHVAHNKLLDLFTKNKMLDETKKFREYIRNAIENFDKEKISMEVEETLQAIDEQKEAAKDEERMNLEIIESESGVEIKNKDEILKVFQKIISSDLEIVCLQPYSVEKMKLQDINKEQLLMKISFEQKILLEIFGYVIIDDSEGASSILKLVAKGINNKDIGEASIEYINGEAEYNVEQGCYMPVTKEELNIEGVQSIIRSIEEYLVDCKW